MLAAGSIIAFIVVIFVVNHRRQPEKPAAPASSLDENNVTNSNSLAVSIDENGLTIAGVKVLPRDPLTTIMRLVGPPSRTNRVDATQSVYAFDSHGLLVYHGGEPSKDSVVIDFEATGGTNGAASRFVGKFEVEKMLISASSDAATLASLKNHGLEGGDTKSGIYRLQYPGLVVIFAFLTNSNRLSLVEIDFN